MVTTPAFASPTLAPYWTSHAVIQQGQPVVVEGTARPGEVVSGTLGDETHQEKAGQDGHFTLKFSPRKASMTPVSLTVGDQRIDDLLVGDVWLCSGQSNMEYPVSRGLDGPGTVMRSADDGLRLFDIPKGSAPHPQSQFASPVQWQAAGPDNVGAFSAACYHMARDLREKLKIPIGAVHASFGGSQIRVWLTPDEALPLYGKEQMDMLNLFGKDQLKAVERFTPLWQAWYRKSAHGSEPWADSSQLKWKPVPQIGMWGDWGDQGLADDPVGTVWLRRTVDLTPEQAKSPAQLALGIIDEVDMTWVNGHPIGNSFGWDYSRDYTVPATFLKAGKNEILVAITNTWGSGGFASKGDKLALTTAGNNRISLADGWNYSRAPVKDLPPRSPWDANAGIGVRHNAMVAPLGHVAMKGAAWYQGESDVNLPGYADRMKGLFAGWRTQFSNNMRMLVVQLANYGPPQLAPTQSGWAIIREAQREAVVADSNAALVTAIDLGERTDIHPANKTVLGERLALAAMGDNLIMPQAAVAENGDIRISFSGVKDALHTWSGNQILSIEMCGADEASCRYAEARPDETSVLVKGDGKPVSRIRYGWADSPIVNVYDDTAIPLPGFELPVTQ
ncbi:sialate O-acetylesterase [Altererythrobacter indicus]|uniref:Sialate O-acetylesterase n=2 Tax=Altericroceibacterium indicum TaxID=374177 RepID=A0A845AB72_9SPHN|nr:sialate O-acetylesterase [Altericroceibacterium indicum]